jgi:hypothetical protein
VTACVYATAGTSWATPMPFSSAYWHNGGSAVPAVPRNASSSSPTHHPGVASAPGAHLPSVPSCEDASASLAEIQAALLQPGGGVIQQQRTPLVDSGSKYKLGCERVVVHGKAFARTRLTRILEVRTQEKLWARFQAAEFRALVQDHHVELTSQLHEGWLTARVAKQKELERDYSGAVVGVGKAHAAAAAIGTSKSRKSREKENAHKRFDAELR